MAAFFCFSMSNILVHNAYHFPPDEFKIKLKNQKISCFVYQMIKHFKPLLEIELEID